MDYRKLHHAINDHLFIDLLLTLDDGTNQITLNLHKIILYSSCLYFEKLLTMLKEKTENYITIKVPNAFVSYDIIMSFYCQKTNIGNLPTWQHILESVKCHDFFGLPFDSNLLSNLDVPNEGFELLLSIIELVDCDENVIKTIIKNLPKRI